MKKNIMAKVFTSDGINYTITAEINYRPDQHILAMDGGDLHLVKVVSTSEIEETCSRFEVLARSRFSPAAAILKDNGFTRPEDK